MARKKIIAGNWKMNMTPSEAVALVETLKPLVKTEEADVVFCVPAIDIIPVVKACEGQTLRLVLEYVFRGEGRIHRRDLPEHADRCRRKICDHRTFREKRVLC